MHESNGTEIVDLEDYLTKLGEEKLASIGLIKKNGKFYKRRVHPEDVEAQTAIISLQSIVAGQNMAKDTTEISKDKEKKDISESAKATKLPTLDRQPAQKLPALRNHRDSKQIYHQRKEKWKPYEDQLIKNAEMSQARYGDPTKPGTFTIKKSILKQNAEQAKEFGLNIFKYRDDRPLKRDHHHN